MSESNMVVCKKCELLKIKIEAGKYPKGKTKKYIDQFGKLWNGKTCAECNKDRCKNSMKASRTFKNVEPHD